MIDLPAAITDILNADYAVKCYSGETRMQSQLNAAFDFVAPKDNWKGPIDAYVPGNISTKLIMDAVIHFTGSKPRITKRPGEPMHVIAAGYYASVGA